MPWEKSFDRDEALLAALQVFWRQGFERTSYDDLVKEASASRYGLYQEFGDKRSLYLAALDRYRDGPVTSLLGPLEEEGAGLSELKDYFANLVSAFRNPTAAKGCFMSLSAMDLAPHDTEIALRVRANFARVRGAYEVALKQAQSDGDWPTTRDAAAVAAVLYAVVQGAAVLQRGGEDTSQIAGYVESSAVMLI